MPTSTVSAASDSLRVLDIEKRRVVVSEPNPTGAEQSCDALVVGGGVGGVAAAEALARRGVSVIIAEPTHLLGGQFTSQCVPVPDENTYIEKQPGASTASYRALRERVRAHYRAQPGVKPDRAGNIGQCWVSRVSGTPDVWESAIESTLNGLRGASGIKRIYLRHQIRAVHHSADGRFESADLVDLDTGHVLRVRAKFLLDATEDGGALALAGCPTAIGQESKAEFGELHAPARAYPDRVQSFTYCFVVRWRDGATETVSAPHEYSHFKSLGEYSLNYEYFDRGTIPYHVLNKAPGAGGPFWTYRRLVAASSFEGGHSPENDLALINWRGNDFHEESFLGKSPDEQARVLERAYQFSRGFLHWLQTESPRDPDPRGSGGGHRQHGYPEMQPATDLPGLKDGFAIAPYVRDSRRLKAKFTLTENHLHAPHGDPGARWGEAFFDSVGCAQYAIDIHPIQGEPHLLTAALPYHIPLGALLTSGGPVNVLPAGKDFGGTRLALASARMHPTEWLIGEVSGSLAAFCLKRHISDPAKVREDHALLSAFQQDLHNAGVSLYWRDILPPAAHTP